jgi:hypothetical protein
MHAATTTSRDHARRGSKNMARIIGDRTVVRHRRGAVVRD